MDVVDDESVADGSRRQLRSVEDWLMGLLERGIGASNFQAVRFSKSITLLQVSPWYPHFVQFNGSRPRSQKINAHPSMGVPLVVVVVVGLCLCV